MAAPHSATGSQDGAKRAAAEAAAADPGIRDGMLVGLGTGTTVAHFLPALAGRGLNGLTCVATSPATEAAARDLGLTVVAFDQIERLDVAVDGADQVAPDRWLVKGGHGAHTREKVVAAAADRFVVIATEDKLVDRLRAPVPLEVLRFGLASTLAAIARLLGPARIRDGASPSPEGNVIADYLGDPTDPAHVAAALDSIPGLVGHGLFPPVMVAEVLIGDEAGGVRRF
jgi:ribose 5-phosphate isomerase A